MKGIFSYDCNMRVDFSENSENFFKSRQQRSKLFTFMPCQQSTLHTEVVCVECTIFPSKQKALQPSGSILTQCRSVCKANISDVVVDHFFFLAMAHVVSTSRKVITSCWTLGWLIEAFRQVPETSLKPVMAKECLVVSGGLLRRQADQLVRQHHDLGLSIKLCRRQAPHWSSSLSVHKTELANSPANLPSVPGTVEIHQVATVERRQVLSRDASCMSATRRKLY